MSSSEGKSREEIFLHRLKMIVIENLENENFGVEDLAQKAGTSRSNLHRKLKKLQKKSVSQFIREIRLEKALEMLRRNEATVSEIAYKVGFSSPSYFNTCFREHYGFPPGEAKFRSQSGRIKQNFQPAEGHLHSATKNKGLKWSIKMQERRHLAYFSVIILIALALIFIVNSTETVSPAMVESHTGGKSIAVMPFHNWSGDPDLEYVSDGMTDAVISRLSKIKSLDKVVPFNSVLQYKNSSKSVPQIARELEVENVLQGNFQLAGNQMKIGLQLINAETNNQFWSSEYEGRWKTGDIFLIQAQVAENIASRLNADVKKEEKIAIQKPPTSNEEAYLSFIEAEFLATKQTREAYEKAIPLYERAIRLDSTFIEAYQVSAIAWAFGGLIVGMYPEDVAWKHTKELLEAAYKLDPSNRETKKLLTYGYYFFEWNFEGIERNFQNYLNDPGKGVGALPIVDYAIKTGRAEESLRTINKIIMADKSPPFQYHKKAEALLFAGKEEEASEFLKIADAMFTDNIYHLSHSAWLHLYLGEEEKAWNLVEKLNKVTDERSALVNWLNALYQDSENQAARRDFYLEEIKNQYETGQSGSPAMQLANYYAIKNDKERAFLWLQRAFAKHEEQVLDLGIEPFFETYRDDPRFKEIMKKINFPVNPLEDQ